MIWKPVPGLSNYEATECGLVRSLGREITTSQGGKFYRAGKVLSPTMHRAGLRYCLRNNDGVSFTTTPQRVTYETFVGTIPDGYGVVMIDNTKAASVDNIKLKRIGFRQYVESQRKPAKLSPYGQEQGYCTLMGNFLRMRYEHSMGA